MQLHNLHPGNKGKSRKRIGRGGKRGTYAGRGSKGQKSRAGHRIRPGFRGGNEPIWKVFPKRRGASKKLNIRRALFQVHHAQNTAVNLATIDRHFKEGEKVTVESLVEKKIIRTGNNGVKILGNGMLTKKLVFDDKLTFSQSARGKIDKNT